ncbi:hypothetical protein LCGC14_0181210 [marine sediment metagenome]|uniref:Uncharacterized protein n=1 Tax=marine sediment metagenome TaxID=412755 RepID=A0A0F9XS25_9ZZZZ
MMGDKVLALVMSPEDDIDSQRDLDTVSLFMGSRTRRTTIAVVRRLWRTLRR